MGKLVQGGRMAYSQGASRGRGLEGKGKKGGGGGLKRESAGPNKSQEGVRVYPVAKVIRGEKKKENS